MPSRNTLKKADLVNNKSFTLLEMLATMAIILVLAFLLHPAAMKAIKAVEGIQCTNNLRQLGQGLAMYLQDYGIYPPSVRYAPSGEEGSLVDALTSYIDNQHSVFICPSTDESFKFNELSYVYHQDVKKNATDDWLLVCARLPESSNPHLGDRANILWIDGHIGAEVIETPEEE